MIGAYAWDELSGFSSNTYLDLHRKNLTNSRPVRGVGMAIGLYRRFFTNPLQNIYGGKWRAGNGTMAIYFGIRSESISEIFLVAFLLAKFGEPMKEKIDKHFNLLALLFGLLLIGGIVVLKFLR